MHSSTPPRDPSVSPPTPRAGRTGRMARRAVLLAGVAVLAAALSSPFAQATGTTEGTAAPPPPVRLPDIKAPAAPAAAQRSAAAVDRVTPERLARAGAAKARLDTKMRRVPAEVASWYVDEITGQTIVSVTGTTPTPAVADFVADPDPAAVLVVPFSRAPKPLAATDLLGGQTITNSGVRCSVGFGAVGADKKPVFLTAGHCTKTAGTWAGVNRAAIGPVVATAWPKTDYGSVSIANPAVWASRAQVSGGPAVKGSTVAAVGAAVCHAGSTTGYRCGTITARNVSVNYGNGNVVSGLTKTNACAEGGDSGGAFITPAGQAQGVASGAVGDCTKGGVSYFQPIAPVLSALKLTLLTSP